MNLLLLLLTLGFAYPLPAQAEVLSRVTVEYSTSTAPLILNYFAAKYGIDYHSFSKTAYCESRYRSDAVGDGGKSFGVFQIHLPSHPYISKDEALDPWFAIDWAAQQFKLGKQKMWTCYRLLASADG